MKQNPNRRILDRITKPTKTVGRGYPLLAIDVENDTKTADFICAGVYGQVKTLLKGRTRIRNVEAFIESEDELCNLLAGLRKGSCMLTFFNLSYDKIFLEKVINHNATLRNGTRTIRTKLKESGITLMDLTNHADGSLADWINYLDMEKEHGVTKKDLKDLKQRVMNDVKATYILGSFLKRFYAEECGIPFKLTVSSSALFLFKKKYFKDRWVRDLDKYPYLKRCEELEQEAYYGGRTELFRKGSFDIYEYDINSAYLSIMRDKLFPDVDQMRTHYVKRGENWQKYWDRGYQMIMRCKVHVPNCYIPILPYRINGKLCFPRGTFTGTWTSVELAEAMRHGTKILECYEFVYYSQSKPYFKEFAEFVWARRAEYKRQGNGGMDKMIKKIGNSLYGKFAQRNEEGGYFGLSEEYDGFLPDGKFMVFKANGKQYLHVKGNEVPSSHYFPAIAAFITSYCRLKLLEAIKQDEDAIIYCDTDGVKLTRPVEGIKVSDELGDWAYEGKVRSVVFHRPKMYGDKRKGVPKRATLIKDTEEYEIWEYQKPLKEREAIRRGEKPCKWVTVRKILFKKDDKREWDDNLSTPLLVEEDKLKEVKECESCGCFTYDWMVYQTIEWQYKRGGGWHGDTFVERKPRRTAGKTIEKIYCYDCYKRISNLKEG